jgi:uncharacterized protein YndB with AHSA1/START domain
MAQETMVRGTTFTEPSDTEIVATRTFDGPRQLVWDAHTKCEHLQNWQTGPEGGTMPTCEMDLRPGGKWRNVYGDGAGGTFEMGGVYREIVPLERIVNTEVFEGNEAIDTMTLTEENGKTKLTVSVKYPSHEALEGAKSTGMEDGWAQGYDRLEEYLKTLR